MRLLLIIFIFLISQLIALSHNEWVHHGDFTLKGTSKSIIQAGNEIRFRDGFYSESGSEMIAKISPCSLYSTGSCRGANTIHKTASLQSLVDNKEVDNASDSTIWDEIVVYCLPNESIVFNYDSTQFNIKPWYAFELNHFDSSSVGNDTVIVRIAEIDTMFTRQIVVKNYSDSTISIFYSDSSFYYCIIFDPFDTDTIAYVRKIDTSEHIIRKDTIIADLKIWHYFYSNEIIINFTTNIDANWDLTVYNLSGQECYKKTIKNHFPYLKEQIVFDVSAYNSGLYYCVLRSKNQVVSKPFIIIR